MTLLVGRTAYASVIMIMSRMAAATAMTVRYDGTVPHARRGKSQRRRRRQRQLSLDHVSAALSPGLYLLAQERERERARESDSSMREREAWGVLSELWSNMAVAGKQEQRGISLMEPIDLDS